MNQPLLLPPGQAQQEQPPQIMTNFNISPDGMLISIQFPNGLTISQPVNEDMMNQITAKWLETRREVKRMRQLALDVVRTKER